ncbi:glucosamine-6-phosphate deaminase [Mycoplasmopsis agassizii]|uniref:Glucosamine-6-phosphate deaminase n=1 Tax=Mycoplasmopsis agassizii TaxID=33922 RepID=A0ABX4H442_9BACT|nr:glucosamine-6-phosphate deaminase [Mycoplasmopsis agassizii]PAF54655.1 glucosamine-6-phosphate deaminase [Mycoplasmopsis agassizii]SMC16134.1 glucosamine-6-phosphate deaminase [Mycoplasmopsis agassizii]
MKIEVYKNYELMSERAAEIITNLVMEKPDAKIVFATGNTPVATYEKLVRNYQKNLVSFEEVKSFNLDEYVGLDETDKHSFRYFMNKHLFDHINIKKRNIAFPKAIDMSLEALNKYDRKIDKVKTFDLLIMGIGTNGHIAFNEPYTDWDLRTHFVSLDRNTLKDNFCDENARINRAITMGISDILKAKQIIVLANGSKKAKIVKTILNAKVGDLKIPATALQQHKNVTLILDQESAAGIEAKNDYRQVE